MAVLSYLTQLILSILVPALTLAAQDDSPLHFVDPLIGTTNGGHVFPGASLPFAMAKSVADVSSGEAQGGYASDDSDSKEDTSSDSQEAR